jgi:hypothetical protein
MSSRDELPIEITHKVSDASLPLLMVDAVRNASACRASSFSTTTADRFDAFRRDMGE